MFRVHTFNFIKPLTWYSDLRPLNFNLTPLIWDLRPHKKQQRTRQVKQRTLLLKRCLNQLKLPKKKLVKSQVVLPQPWENHMKSHTRMMKLEKMKLNTMLLKRNMTLVLAQFWNNWNRRLLNSLELCNKKPVKLLKMFKRKLEKQKRMLVQL